MEKKNKRKRRLRKARILECIFLFFFLLILSCSVSAIYYSNVTCIRFNNASFPTSIQQFAYSFIGASNCQLSSFSFSSESGCITTYTGTACNSSQIFGNPASLTFSEIVSLQNNTFGKPLFAGNISCTFIANNIYTQKKYIYRAWRVVSSAGQVCTIQNRWNYYVYVSGYPNISFSLLPSPNVASSNITEIYCSGSYSGNCVNVGGNSTSTSSNYYPTLFILDFTQKIYIILLVIFFIIIIILIFYRYIMYASILIIIWGFIFLFSGLNVLVSFLIIAIGCIFAVIFGGRR